MQMPLDIKEVMQAAADTEAARNMPIRLSIFIDKESSEEFAHCVVNAFQTKVPAAVVTIQDYPQVDFVPDYRNDLAVLVAGFSCDTGALSDRIRAYGIPVMVATNMPEIVAEQALISGFPLLKEDLLSPSIEVDCSILPPDHVFNCEPYPLTVDRARTLLNKMGEWIVSTFREKRLAFALAFPFVRRPLSVEFVNATAIQNAGVGLVLIIPGADMPVMTLNQAKMILQVAAAYDQNLGKERIIELLAVVGGGFACRAVARQLVSLVPVLGWAIKAGVGFSGTVAMGFGAISYFEALQEGTIEPVDAVAIAQAEMAKVQDAIRGAQTPSDAVFAAAQVLVTDVSVVAIDKGKKALPFIRSAAANICESSNIKPVDLGKKTFDVLLQLRK